MKHINKKVKIYGAERCHKSQFYQQYFKDKGLVVEFLDVEQDPEAAAELRSLYTNGKLNFPTLLIGDKKLRNPRTGEIEKWLEK